MFWIIYNLLLHLYFVITLPFYIIKFFTKEKYRGGLKHRLGFVPKFEQKPRVLVHAVSVGEFLAAVPLINIIKERFLEYELVISTTTTTGNKVAKKHLKDLDKSSPCAQELDKIIFFPLDFSWAVNRFFNRVSPDIIVLVETELWPNFLRTANKNNIPVIVVNGRISAHSFKNYSKFKKIFVKIGNTIFTWGMQFNKDAKRLEELGINPEKIHVTGSLKFDSVLQRIQNICSADELKDKFGLTKETLVLVGGSTHNGEERILLDLYQDLKDNFTKLILIIAPRHPERIKELKILVDSYRLNYILKSNLISETKLSNYEVVLVDTLGELISIYSLADVVFVGKSIKKGGGQNILEPAALGKAVICGPLMDNFREITSFLVENNGVIQVRNEKQLEDVIRDLLNSQEKRNALGRKAKELVRSASSVTERDMDLIEKVIKK